MPSGQIREGRRSFGALLDSARCGRRLIALPPKYPELACWALVYQLDPDKIQREPERVDPYQTEGKAFPLPSFGQEEAHCRYVGLESNSSRE